MGGSQRPTIHFSSCRVTHVWPLFFMCSMFYFTNSLQEFLWAAGRMCCEHTHHSHGWIKVPFDLWCYCLIKNTHTKMMFTVSNFPKITVFLNLSQTGGYETEQIRLKLSQNSISVQKFVSSVQQHRMFLLVSKVKAGQIWPEQCVRLKKSWRGCKTFQCRIRETIPETITVCKSW